MFGFARQFKSRPVIGLEIAPGAIHCVVARGSKKQPHLINYHAARDDQLAIHNPQQFTETLEKLLAKIPGKQITLGINDALLTAHYLSVTKTIKAADLEKIVELELERCLPYPLNDAYFDFTILPVNNNSATTDKKVLIMAGRKSLIDPQLQCLTALGFKVTQVNNSASVLNNFLLRSNSAVGTVGLINFTSETAQIVITQNRQHLFTEIIHCQSNDPSTTMQLLLNFAIAKHPTLLLDQLLIAGCLADTEISFSNLRASFPQQMQFCDPFMSWKNKPINPETTWRYTLAAALAWEGLRK